MTDWRGQFESTLHPTTVVIGRGMLVTDQGSFPAVYTRGGIYGQEWVWAPTGRNGKTENHRRDGRFRNGWYKLRRGRHIQLDGFPIK